MKIGLNFQIKASRILTWSRVCINNTLCGLELLLFSIDEVLTVGAYLSFKHQRLSMSLSGDSLVAQTVRDPSAMQETQVQSLGQEYPLEKGMTTHSSILAWRIPWREKPDVLQPMGLQRVGHN